MFYRHSTMDQKNRKSGMGGETVSMIRPSISFCMLPMDLQLTNNVSKLLAAVRTKPTKPQIKIRVAKP